MTPSPQPPPPVAVAAPARARERRCATRSSPPPHGCCSRPARPTRSRSGRWPTPSASSRRPIYRHFADKTDLIFEVRDRHFAALDAAMEQAAQGIIDPVGRL